MKTGSRMGRLEQETQGLSKGFKKEETSNDVSQC